MEEFVNEIERLYAEISNLRQKVYMVINESLVSYPAEGYKG